MADELGNFDDYKEIRLTIADMAVADVSATRRQAMMVRVDGSTDVFSYHYQGEEDLKVRYHFLQGMDGRLASSEVSMTWSLYSYDRWFIEWLLDDLFYSDELIQFFFRTGILRSEVRSWTNSIFWQALMRDRMPALRCIMQSKPEYIHSFFHHRFGYPPLFYAATSNRYEFAKLLVDQGEDPDEMSHGRTPLMLACIGNQVKTARLLLEHGANPNVRVNSEKQTTSMKHQVALQSETLLFRACRKNHGELARLLLDHSADAEIRSSQGVAQYVHVARKNKNCTDILFMFLREYPYKIRFEKISTNRKVASS